MTCQQKHTYNKENKKIKRKTTDGTNPLGGSGLNYLYIQSELSNITECPKTDNDSFSISLVHSQRSQ